MSTLQQLRVHAIAESLFKPTTLKAALDRMSFVQADPIQSPARAQDLILRHRVRSYRVGQLDRQYPDLEIEEDILYAYGFLPRRVWHLLQPRQPAGLGQLERKVLEAVTQFGQTHPRDLQAHLGRRRVVNDWGGYSVATTRTLERLHLRGLLRIARREKGIRVYEPARPYDLALSSHERLRKLILTIAGILAPVPERVLRSQVTRYRRWGNPRSAVDAALRTGELERQVVDGVAYLWPSTRRRFDESPNQVRFLAPFDPLVWDRRRFEHFWGWSYRFEAYTPLAKRVRGYYAMPLLWRDNVIGWTNVGLRDGHVSVEPGFVGKRPSEPAFRREFEREVESLKAFLGLESGG
ncbi:MAG TPA: crosslink repair DNA glycosylase YcaQ family protein [Terriglobia bacterium]|nr:crosslink repair DNA glycosylase YcaQ family protein [Terriglobia bacterium]